MVQRISAMFFLCTSLLGSLAMARTDEFRRIQVRGDAEILLPPTSALIVFGVETVDRDVRGAKTQNDGRSKKVLDAVLAAKIPQKDIRTDLMTVDSRMVYPDGRSAEQQFVVRRDVVVVLRDLQQFEALLQSGIEAGANSIRDITYETDDLRKHRDSVRDLALKAAREKATAMAATLGVHLGVPLEIQEIPTGASLISSARNPALQNVVQTTSEAAPSSGESVLFGKIRVAATVQVTFAID